jgi:hypothetical protein
MITTSATVARADRVRVLSDSAAVAHHFSHEARPDDGRDATSTLVVIHHNHVGVATSAASAAAAAVSVDAAAAAGRNPSSSPSLLLAPPRVWHGHPLQAFLQQLNRTLEEMRPWPKPRAAFAEVVVINAADAGAMEAFRGAVVSRQVGGWVGGWCGRVQLIGWHRVGRDCPGASRVRACALAFALLLPAGSARASSQLQPVALSADFGGVRCRQFLSCCFSRQHVETNASHTTTMFVASTHFDKNNKPAAPGRRVRRVPVGGCRRQQQRRWRWRWRGAAAANPRTHRRKSVRRVSRREGIAVVHVHVRQRRRRRRRRQHEDVVPGS